MDLMIDIETTGLRPGCGVLSIGACLFEPDAPQSRAHFDSNNHLLVYISSFDSLNNGLRIESATQRWWKNEEFGPEVHRNAANSEVSVARACQLLADFIRDRRPDCFWANSPRFDIEILWTLFEKSNVTVPIHHRKERDFRTVMDTVFPKREDRPERPDELRAYPAHHPLGDAILQADQLRQALARLTIEPAPSELSAQTLQRYAVRQARQLQRTLDALGPTAPGVAFAKTQRDVERALQALESLQDAATPRAASRRALPRT